MAMMTMMTHDPISSIISCNNQCHHSIMMTTSKIFATITTLKTSINPTHPLNSMILAMAMQNPPSRSSHPKSPLVCFLQMSFNLALLLAYVAVEAKDQCMHISWRHYCYLCFVPFFLFYFVKLVCIFKSELLSASVPYE